jgi:hypothetical protein
VNILHEVDALNRRHSSFTVYSQQSRSPGTLKLLDTLVLHGSRLTRFDVIRLGERPLMICVSSRFKQAFESAGCTGIEFVAVESIE